MNKLEKKLQECGLTEKSVQVYLTLLRIGSSHVTHIANSADLYRPDTYKALDDLKKRGLAEEVIVGKRIYFRATHPKNIKKSILALASQVDQIASDLEAQYEKGQQQTDLIAYSGKLGLQEVFRDVVETLEKGDTFYRYSTAKNQKKTNQYVPDDYREVRDEKNLERFVITNSHVKESKKKRLERELKVIPKEFDDFDQDIIQFIYGDKVSFIDIKTERGVIIQNKKLAEFQKKVFQLLYKKI